MLKILYVVGPQDTTIPINPAHITGVHATDRASANLTKFVAGRMVTVGTDGYATLTDGSHATLYRGTEGVIINDAIGNDFENWPALASGVLPVMKGLIETDQVVETDLAPGDILYAGTSSNVGLFTNTAPQSGVLVVVGVARSSNSSSDKTTRIRML